MEGNRGSLLWVLILILVILIAAAAAIIKFMPKDTAPEPRPAASRAKVPPPPASAVPSPPPQAMEAIATPPVEPKSAGASPNPGPMSSPQAKDAAATDLKSADTPKAPPAETAANVKEPAAPVAPPMAPAPATPKAEPSPIPAPKPKGAEVKQEEKSVARLDLDKMAPYTIQVGAFRSKANADEVLSQLTKKGYAPFVFQITDAQQRSFYMVRFGHFGSREEAAKALDAFKQKEKSAAVIVRSGMM